MEKAGFYGTMEAKQGWKNQKRIKYYSPCKRKITADDEGKEQK